MRDRGGTGCFISWARWESPRQWSKAHDTYVDEYGDLRPLCGAVQPSDSQDGGICEADGFCRRCEAIARRRAEELR